MIDDKGGKRDRKGLGRRKGRVHGVKTNVQPSIDKTGRPIR